MNQAAEAICPKKQGRCFLWLLHLRRGEGYMAGTNGQYTCMEYRREMVLLALRRRIEQEELTEAEKQDLRARLLELESEMEMD